MTRKAAAKSNPDKLSRKVIVECYPDEILIKALGLGRKEISHQNSKGEVCNYLEKEDIKIGIVDEDPGSGQPKKMNDFKEAEVRFNVKKLVHPTSGKIILVIKPRLEEWILGQCEKSKVNPTDFHLPKEAKRLKDRININLDKFRNLVDGLKESDNEGLKYLKSVIEASYKIG